jgi:hypothetical protein
MCLWKKDYTQTVEAYKDALRNKPSDETDIITHWQKKDVERKSA